MEVLQDQRVSDFVRNRLLEPDESILWEARPSVGRSAWIGARWFALGVFLICGAAFLYAAIILLGFVPVILRLMDMDTPTLFWVAWFAGIFWQPLFGFWCLTAPLRFGRRARRTYYLITEKRLIILTAGMWKRVRSVSGRDVGNYSRVGHRNGVTDFHFHTKSRLGGSTPRFLPKFKDGFWGIEDARVADAAITALRERAAT